MRFACVGGVVYQCPMPHAMPGQADAKGKGRQAGAVTSWSCERERDELEGLETLFPYLTKPNQ